MVLIANNYHNLHSFMLCMDKMIHVGCEGSDHCRKLHNYKKKKIADAAVHVFFLQCCYLHSSINHQRNQSSAQIMRYQFMLFVEINTIHSKAQFYTIHVFFLFT